MSDEIPADIWVVAQDVAHDVYEADCQLMETGETPVNTALVIGFAILAERERAAKIAEAAAASSYRKAAEEIIRGHTVRGVFVGSFLSWTHDAAAVAAVAIASAIRSSHE